MNDIDNILRTALSPNQNPSNELNQKIMKKIKDGGKMRYRSKKSMIAAAILLCLIVIPASVYASYKYLLPKEAALQLEDKKLGDAFHEQGTEVLETITDDLYTVTFLGYVTGESISERAGSAWELQPERTYVAVAIEKVDKSPMTYDDELFVSPLIQGLEPWNYNIASMQGSYMGQIIDGILYRIIEMDSVEIFADRKIYLAVSNTNFYSVEAYNYDSETGIITINESFPKTNVLFDIPMDSSKADSKKAEEYLEKIEESWKPTEESEVKSSKDSDILDDSTYTDPRIQQELFEDIENDIRFYVNNNYSPNWSSAWSSSHISSFTTFPYSIKVEGKDIESITYALNKGEFGKKSGAGNTEFYGNQLSVLYDEQEKDNISYCIMFEAMSADYGYDPNELEELWIKDQEETGKIYYEMLNKEVESTNITVTIKKKDGNFIEKLLTLDNVVYQECNGFWIVINME